MYQSQKFCLIKSHSRCCILLENSSQLLRDGSGILLSRFKPNPPPAAVQPSPDLLGALKLQALDQRALFEALWPSSRSSPTAMENWSRQPQSHILIPCLSVTHWEEEKGEFRLCASLLALPRLSDNHWQDPASGEEKKSLFDLVWTQGGKMSDGAKYKMKWVENP